MKRRFKVALTAAATRVFIPTRPLHYAADGDARLRLSVVKNKSCID